MTEQTLTAREVSRYLAAHPDFLVQHADLLAHLLPAGRDLGGDVTDLQQVMVGRLRSQVELLKADHRNLLSIGHSNDETLARFHGAALALLDAVDLPGFIAVISEKLASVLGVDKVVLGIESENIDVPPLRRFKSGAIESWLGPADSMLKAHAQAMPEIFGDAPVRSLALLRLELGEGYPPALLAFGSFDPEWFTPDQATDLAEFLGGVAARCLKRLLPL